MKLKESKRLKIAIPNKGRLKEPTIELFKRAGYKFRQQDKALYATCTNDDAVFVFVRADDIPVLVDCGVIDLGVTGQDLVLERNASVVELMPFGFGKCRLCVAADADSKITSLKKLKGKNIATSFPRITQKFFKQHGVSVNCVELNGSVEIMVSLDLASAIVDLVETGDSLRRNGLNIIADIGKYETVLIAQKHLKKDPRILKLKRRLEGILVASHYSILEYNVPVKKLKQAEKIAPGFESPTVSTLEDKNWVAVKVMVKKSDVIAIMEHLEAIGATAIMETKIHNCRL